MLKDILKTGDTIYKTGINEMIDSIVRQLNVWSIPQHDKERLETELDELQMIIHIMYLENIESIKWYPELIKDYSD